MRGIAAQLNGHNEDGDIGDLKITLVRDSENKILSGLTISNVLEQNQALILIMEPSESKEYPTMGVGMTDQLLGEDLLEKRHDIRRNFAMDKLKIEALELYRLDNIKIKATY